MNRLKKRDKMAVLALLERGHSDRSVERILGVNANTIGRIRRGQMPKKTGRPTLGVKAKSHIIPVRFSETEHALLLEKAKHCKSFSEWARRALRRAAQETLKSEEANH